MVMKLCGKCTLSKPMDEFNNHSKTKDGKYYACRSCQNITKKLYRQDQGKKVDLTVKEMEKFHIKRVLLLEKNMTKAAKRLGICRDTLSHRIRAYGETDQFFEEYYGERKTKFGSWFGKNTEDTGWDFVYQKQKMREE